MEYQELLTIAVEAARLASKVVTSGQPTAFAGAQTKSTPTDMVTQIDKLSEETIRNYILTRRPEDGFIGEEGKHIASDGVTWVVDPIDGTTNFMYDFPAYAVSIAAQIDEETVCGAVLDVPRGELFTAVKGGGAFRDGLEIKPRQCTLVREALVSTGFAYDAQRRALQARALAHLIADVRDIRRAGAASLDLAWVACGRSDGYYEAGLKPWDYEAAALIVREAGGLVGSWDSTSPSEEMTIAANPTLFYPLRDAITKAFALT